jgi:hypothetical protein
MRRALTSAFAAALVALGAAGHAQAQDLVVRTAPQFDIGIFAGGAYTTDWFSIGGEGYKPEFSPVFGAEATFWLSPTFGLRLDGKYLPSHMPKGPNFDSDRWLENVWTYDLDLVWRPMFWSGTGFMSSMYVFVGGGGLTADPPGSGECLGIAAFAANGVCVSGNAKHGTVGQGVAGLGFDVFPLMSGLGVFLEAGVHGYDSPSHVFENNQKTAEDKFTFTPYAVLGLKLGFGNIIPPPPPPPPAPLPQPQPLPQPEPQPQPQPTPPQDVNYCVVQNGQLTSVTVQYNPATGDTTYNGQPVSTALPATTGYAGAETWYINTEPIQFNGRRYVKYGLPRILGTSDVNNVGTVNNVSVFAEPSANAQRPEVIYVPTRPGCEFQPYQLEVKAGGVRG